VSIACLDRGSLERRQFRADECRFAYRQSRFKREDRDRYIILEVTLRLRKQARPLLRYAELAEEVRRTAPIDALAPAAALGAVRGVKVPAARLVERAGFAEAYRRGGVGSSSNHALALVNHGGTTGELLALAESIERGVYDRFGIRLEREPVVVG